MNDVVPLSSLIQFDRCEDDGRYVLSLTGRFEEYGPQRRVFVMVFDYAQTALRSIDT